MSIGVGKCAASSGCRVLIAEPGPTLTGLSDFGFGEPPTELAATEQHEEHYERKACGIVRHNTDDGPSEQEQSRHPDIAQDGQPLYSHRVLDLKQS
ncbi:hypothetical protein [Burkholderia multivorans]|uniref:hypothetical protein n=1 Tax=Burkholderia multivorans TaxID=87883 RepID=UPI001F17FCF0|nr:hypothetical protein [Burkholderia multivorans]